ncbi:MAG: tRNA (guanine(10)-N(2))-dimethyltransferase, partial [Candidatus Methanofastidiosia archaeon]
MELVEFREGKARILAPKFEKLTSRAKVFYNPEMSFDRDLSSLLISSSADRLEVCDALSGTGIRGIRYALECKSKVHLNDLNPKSYKLIKENLKLNNIEAEVSNIDANILLREIKFDVVDIDPFGSPVYYLDS